MRPIPLIVIALFLVQPIQAWADTPETIQACYKNLTGRLRVVTDTAECKPSESPITWSGQQATPPRWQLVGFTTATFDGDEGVLGFTLACQAEFPDSRMCTSIEILETTEVPLGLGPSLAWVRPTVVSGVSTRSVVDASGLAEGDNEISCAQWTSANEASSGLAVDSSGRFFITGTCAQPMPAACCALVP